MYIGMAELIMIGVIIGCWAYVFAQLVNSQNIFAGYGRAVNRVLNSSADNPFSPDPSTLKGWRYVLWKYTYCAFCIAGASGVVVALTFSVELTWPNFSFSFYPWPLIIIPPVAMATAKLLEAWTNK
jgi:hypothetical protein